VLLLAGFDRPPASFRVPDGFEVSRQDSLQHFVVVEYRAQRARPVAPQDVADVDLDDSDLQVLRPRS
jgi:hypothetical protein